MKNIFKNYQEIFIVFICLFVIIVTNVLSGYSLDAGFLGSFTPFIIIILFFILGFMSIAFALLPFYKLIDKEERNRITYINAISCLIVWVFVFLPITPSGIDGARYKLSKINEVEYQNFLVEVEKAYSKYSNESKYSSISSSHYMDFLNDLKSSKHKIFDLSSFPIDIFKRQKHVVIDWSSGLTGGYEVIIFEKNNFPELLNDYKYTFLYDTVAFKYID